MKVKILNSPLDEHTIAALANFEQEFSYPFGTDSRFRISHGANYCNFYQSMGESIIFVLEEQDRIIGIIAASLRELYTPNGEQIFAAYVGDFKISEQYRRTRAAYILIKELEQWIFSRTKYAFSIVMDGTDHSPLSYTGRAGISKFDFLSQVSILRIDIDNEKEIKYRQSLVNMDRTKSLLLYRQLTTGHWSMKIGSPFERSTQKPQWIATEDDSCCGCIENTQKAKRLIMLNAGEIHAAHLSNFAYKDPNAGAETILAAVKHASEHNYSSLFVSINNSDVAFYRRFLDKLTISEAKANIFGNLPVSSIAGSNWFLNTSEI